MKRSMLQVNDKWTLHWIWSFGILLLLSRQAIVLRLFGLHWIISSNCYCEQEPAWWGSISIVQSSLSWKMVYVSWTIQFPCQKKKKSVPNCDTLQELPHISVGKSMPIEIKVTLLTISCCLYLKRLPQSYRKCKLYCKNVGNVMDVRRFNWEEEINKIPI